MKARPKGYRLVVARTFVRILSEKREAIRMCRRQTLTRRPGSRGEVFGRDGKLLYQCHLSMKTGRRVLIVEEL